MFRHVGFLLGVVTGVPLVVLGAGLLKAGHYLVHGRRAAVGLRDESGGWQRVL